MGELSGERGRERLGGAAGVGYEGSMKARRSRKPINPLAVFRHGERFHYGYNALGMASDPHLQAAQGTPQIVLGAFTVELYLKCLLHLQGRRVPDTHLLQMLFHALDTKTQQAFREGWDAHMATDPQLQRIIPVAERVSGKSIGHDFDWHIAAANRAFVEIRYAYEEAPRTGFFLGSFLSWIRNYILSKRPEWGRQSPTLPSRPDVQLSEFAA